MKKVLASALSLIAILLLLSAKPRNKPDQGFVLEEFEKGRTGPGLAA